MGNGGTSGTLGRHAWMLGLAWLSMLAFDTLLHGGVFEEFHLLPSPYLPPVPDAYRSGFPLGYLSSLLLAGLLLWILVRAGVRGWWAGLRAGCLVGVLLAGAFALGPLWMIRASVPKVTGWFLGQATELGIAGAVLGSGLAGEAFPKLLLKTVGFVALLLVIAAGLVELDVPRMLH